MQLSFNALSHAFKQETVAVYESGLLPMAAAVAAIAFLVFGSNLYITCLAALGGYFLTKTLVVISIERYPKCFERLKYVALKLRKDPQYYKIAAFAIALLASKIIMILGVFLSLASGVYLELATEFKNYQINLKQMSFSILSRLNF